MSLESIRPILHTIVEAYLDQLPRRTVVLGGAAKVNVQLGARPAEGIFSEADYGIYPDGVGWIWLPSFDFSALAKADVMEKQLLLLNALHDGLSELARRTASDTREFANAKAAILAGPLPLPEIPEQELRRRWGLIPMGKKIGPAAGRNRRSSKKRPSQ